MNEIEFIDGLIAKAPRDGAPDFLKASISIKRADLIKWLQGRNDEWINADVKESKNGKWYVAVNAWKPEATKQAYEKSKTEVKRAEMQPSRFDDDSVIPF